MSILDKAVEGKRLKDITPGRKASPRKSGGQFGSKISGYTIKDKRYTRFSQFKEKAPGKKTLGDKVSGGIHLAIL